MASMCNCSAWCMIARRVSKPNICRLRILHCLCQHGCEHETFMFPRLPCVCIHLGKVGRGQGALIPCARARVCQRLYVLRASCALVQATVGVGTVIIPRIGVAYTRGGGGVASTKILAESEAPPRRCGLPPFRACLLLARLLLATCLLAACLLAKPVTSTLDTKEGYTTKTVSTSLVS